MKSLLCAAVVGLGVYGGMASAEGAKEEGAAKAYEKPKFELSLRSGVGLPGGNSAGQNKMTQAFAMQVPVTIAAGVRLSPHVYIGGYAGVGIGGTADNVSNACAASNVSCNALSLRFGAEGTFTMNPNGTVRPWVGFGVGLERSNFSFASGGQKAGLAVLGADFARLSAGADIRLSRSLTIGPYADFAMGSYLSQSLSLGDREAASGSIQDKSIHYWVTLGPRINFSL